MIYFDNAATSYPKPISVLESVHSAITEYGGNPGRGGHSFSMRASEIIYKVRCKVASFFNSDPQNVVFTNNCTMSLNMAIKGVLQDGDHVIISSLEHNSVARPIYKLAEQEQISYDIAKVYSDAERTVSSFSALIRENTKAIVCIHSSNVSGVILPIKELGKLCAKRGIIFIVDAAQTAGVVPIDMNDMKIDLLCCAGHKGLFGISGTGLLIVNDKVKLNTIIEGGTGSTSIDLSQPDFSPDRYEAGTVNTAGIFSMGAGIDFISKIGQNNIYDQEFKKCSYVYERLNQIPKINLYTDGFKKYKNTPVICFNIAGFNSDVIVDQLNAEGYALRGGLHCSPLAHRHYGTLDNGMVRFSPSYFSKQVSIEKFVKLINTIAKKA